MNNALCHGLTEKVYNLNRCHITTTEITSCARRANNKAPVDFSPFQVHELESSEDKKALINTFDSDFLFTHFIGHPFKTLAFDQGGQTIGFTSYYLHPKNGNDAIAELAFVYVLPEFRGNGYASLFSACAGIMSQRDNQEIDQNILVPHAYFPPHKRELTHLLLSYAAGLRHGHALSTKPLLTRIN